MLAIGLSCFLISGTGQAAVVESSFGFETVAVPSAFAASQDSVIVCTTERHRFGNQSLRWDWSAANATLAIQVPKDLALKPQSSFLLWAYRQTPLRDCLRLELLFESRVVGRCWWPLSYQGWRPLGVPYEMVGLKNGQKVDTIRLLAPASEPAGRIYLDAIDLQFQGHIADDTQHPWMTADQAQSMKDFIIGHAMYSKMMRFTLIDAETRRFNVERWCFMGGIDDWYFLDGDAPLATLAEKYVKHLGRESFFELM
jgi:hypothetical protein